jgi:hypothetical protein
VYPKLAPKSAEQGIEDFPIWVIGGPKPEASNRAIFAALRGATLNHPAASKEVSGFSVPSVSSVSSCKFVRLVRIKKRSTRFRL